MQKWMQKFPLHSGNILNEIIFICFWKCAIDTFKKAIGVLFHIRWNILTSFSRKFELPRQVQPTITLCTTDLHPWYWNKIYVKCCYLPRQCQRHIMVQSFVMHCITGLCHYNNNWPLLCDNHISGVTTTRVTNVSIIHSQYAATD